MKRFIDRHALAFVYALRISLMMVLCFPTVNAFASAGGGGGGGGTSPYVDLNPAFVVNLSENGSGIRYLQIAVTLKLADENDADVVKKHMPLIRHRLVLLFSSLSFSEISSSQGKIKLTADVLREVKEGLKKMTGKEIVEEVYFPKIVGQ